MQDSHLIYSGYVQGASHIAKGMPCEDYAACYADDHIAVAVISDGHGDKNCFRSAKGANIACLSAIEKTKEIFESFDEVNFEFQNSPKRVITELEKSIIYLWNQKVQEDLLDNPIMESELQELDNYVAETLRSGKKQSKVYGCTLIMAVILKEYWFAIQIGDGKCVASYDNGIYRQPIPADMEGCIGNRSTSICGSDAFENFRYYYGTDLPSAVFVASDGVDESFDENGLNKCYYSVAAILKSYDSEIYHQKMTEILNKISSGGSGDDVSIACIVSKDKELRKPMATSKQVAQKMQQLYNTLRDVEERYIELENKKKELEAIVRNLNTVKEQLKDLSRQFVSAKDIKRNVDKYWESVGNEIEDNHEIMEYEPILNRAEMNSE